MVDNNLKRVRSPKMPRLITYDYKNTQGKAYRIISEIPVKPIPIPDKGESIELLYNEMNPKVCYPLAWLEEKVSEERRSFIGSFVLLLFCAVLIASAGNIVDVPTR